MRFDFHAASQSLLQRFDFGIRQDRRLSIEGHEPYYARQLKNLQPICELYLHEYVSRKQRQFQLLAPVLPSPHGAVQGKEAGEAALLDLLSHTFFVARAGIERVPVSSRIRSIFGTRRVWVNIHSERQMQLRPVAYSSFSSLSLLFS
jgi:hypothetical protein